jgi:hypothetical protein
MKRHLLVFGLLLLVFGALGFNSVLAEDKKMTEEEMMTAYAKYMNPGPQHKLLDPMVGTWDCSSRMWMNPDSLPMTSIAVSEKQWVLGGRFIEENVTGEMMGTMFHGLGLTGYDLINLEYIHVYLDEMSTSMMISKGQVDSFGKIFTFYSKYKDPMDNMKEKEVKNVVTVIDNNKHIFEMYEKGPDGKDKKSFDITYTRKK